MIKKNEVCKLPSLFKWCQLVRLLTAWLLLAIPFSFIGSYYASLNVLFWLFVLPVFLYLLADISVFSFTFDDEKIVIHSGIIFKQSKIIPFNKIQNLKIKRGPILSMFGLADINVWTASQSQLGGKDGKDIRPDGHLYLKGEDAQILSEAISRS